MFEKAFGKFKREAYSEEADPYAIYSWEACAHVISLLMERLKSTGEYELALKVARLPFNPSLDNPKLGQTWLFPLFRDSLIQSSDLSNYFIMRDGKLTAAEWDINHGLIHAAARQRPIIYMK
ncbi:uncharacterized protein BDW47DRAFT_126749 [Aspergillus candidus]|uniref:Uncharacterized protein n=1 Tax=Aspergillus candidus TaxID=41067 RepID=A0A2I2F8X4_ASPCN|nr:hypothetical protein BDW47DRAFT_126749 [Aspergillus candidus]PLB37071.1 hypothetical protein BDW47DRAFT_126749 [Aspergillus candidus]